jgi:hypothetical protein
MSKKRAVRAFLNRNIDAAQPGAVHARKRLEISP